MDLTKQPPRRPSNTALAGIVGLARMSDKARAHEAETLGEYVYGEDSGLDRKVLEFINMDAEGFAAAALEHEDEELSVWVEELSRKSAADKEAFNRELLEQEPQDERHRQLLEERVRKYAPGDTRIRTVLQSMELDDWGAFRERDLSQGPPRSSYVRSVCGLAGLARAADKGRAFECGRLGEYVYGEDSGLDRRLFEFLDLDSGDFAAAAYQNPNDLELSAWVGERTRRRAAEICAFNAAWLGAGLHSPELRERFLERRREICPERGDITTFADLLDYDDEHSFGLVDLERHAPRSPYDGGVGGLTGLARMIDKGRAHNGGTLGEYWYGQDSGIDRAVLEFLGLSAEDFAAGLREHLGDEAVAAWLGERLQKPPQEIESFNHKLQTMGPANEAQEAFVRRVVAQNDPSRTEICSFLAMVALDDSISFARRRAGV